MTHKLVERTEFWFYLHDSGCSDPKMACEHVKWGICISIKEMAWWRHACNKWSIRLQDHHSKAAWETETVNGRGIERQNTQTSRNEQSRSTQRHTCTHRQTHIAHTHTHHILHITYKYPMSTHTWTTIQIPTCSQNTRHVWAHTHACTYCSMHTNMLPKSYHTLVHDPHAHNTNTTQTYMYTHNISHIHINTAHIYLYVPSHITNHTHVHTQHHYIIYTPYICTLVP